MRKKWLSRVVGALLLAGILALLVYGYLPKPLGVEVATVGRGPLVASFEGEGRTRVRERFTLAAPLAGVAERIELEPGAPVQQGEAVARIRPMRSPLQDPQSRASAEANLAAAQASLRQAQAAVQHAEAASQLAKEELERAEVLAKAGAISQQAFEQAQVQARLRKAESAAARSAVNVAGHQVEAAKAVAGALTRPEGDEPLELTSPIQGQVLKVFNESEKAVSPGTPLLEVAEVSALEVVADLLTRDAVGLASGMPAWIERWGGDRPLPGRVQRVEPSAFTRVSPLGVEEQRVNVVVSLEDDPEARPTLGDGYAVEVRFVLWEGKDVLQVPASATFRRGEKWAVFTVSSGRAVLREVRLGRRDPLQVQVLEGLTEGEQVILHPGDAVEEGTRVKAVN